MKLPDDPILFSGGLSTDERGSVRFVNDFNFPGVKRFYHIRNLDTGVIRGFHGHLKEAKYFYVVRGELLLAFVRLTDKQDPDKQEPVNRVFLTDKVPAIQYIPPGFVNGFRILKPNTDIMVFSTATLEESKHDDYRFDHDYWGKEVWKEEL